ncbi:hypothetical protein [Crenothrix polyspora]|uniref:Uncharacterized protein n=1 Tax=Crenothrix polyspora TaxID=360316 RepID=A0A1R4H7Z6_9GAMM|nr:hypothetical protein [Crenothrix polyspora]SJM92398.1 hypothetical protein CRENPOLYSF1_280007 [Crenothrix polyspora]
MTQSNNTVLTRLSQLQDNGKQHMLCGGLKGIEKESLRIGKDGLIAQTISIDQWCSYEYSYSVFNLGQLQPPFALSLSKCAVHASTSSARTVTL